MRNFTRKIREKLSPINKIPPEKIVASVSSIWNRVPVLICSVFYEYKNSEPSAADDKIMTLAMAATDYQVYQNDDTSRAFPNAKKEYLASTKGSEKEQLEKAVYLLLLWEMIEGGTGISKELAERSCRLGFEEISKPIIEEFLNNNHEVSEETIMKYTIKAHSMG